MLVTKNFLSKTPALPRQVPPGYTETAQETPLLEPVFPREFMRTAPLLRLIDARPCFAMPATMRPEVADEAALGYAFPGQTQRAFSTTRL